MPMKDVLFGLDIMLLKYTLSHKTGCTVTFPHKYLTSALNSKAIVPRVEQHNFKVMQVQ